MDTGSDNSNIDRRVGTRIAEGRATLALSRAALADLVGLTEPEIIGLETGAQRASASLLHLLSVALRQPVSFFFGDDPAARQ